MSGQLHGKVALVTGATSGIGQAVAVEYARQGARVVAVGRRAAQGAETVRLAAEAGGEAVFFQADVTREAEIEAMVAFAVARFGGLDAAFNNAGGGNGGVKFAQSTLEDYEETFALNVRGLYLCMRAEIRRMLEQGRGGAIVNCSSIQGHIALGRSPHYTASKHAVEGYTKAAAADHAADGIRVNAIAPGIVLTPMMAFFDPADPKNREAVRRYPAKRVAETKDLVGAAVFLASDAAAYLNGVSLPVDGGYLVM